ncbi:HAMP domain-containing histidine kinase [Candidatus Kaiserbacteria bacterium]|nr:HAMP domain-containing histidine kinase [Candidatus Kaiserbacteria bacterium]
MENDRTSHPYRAPLVVTLLAAIAVAAVETVLSGLVPAIIAFIAVFALGGVWLAVTASTVSRAEQDARQLDTQRKQLDQAGKLLKQQEESAKLLVRRDLELSRANEHLRTLDHLKSDFVTVTTHQLRTPLAAIRWTLQMLAGGDVGPVTEEQKKFLLQAYESNNRLIDMLRDMLLADQIETGKFDRTNAQTDPATVVDALFKEIAGLAEKQGVALKFEHPDKPILIAIDPKHLQTVLQNLIENAVKYTKQGGNVTVEVVPGIGQVAISVADTGIGIPQPAQDSIFSRFFRAQNAVTMATDGTGLGLYIAKRIVEHYKGTLSFTSAEGAGTTFVFTLPSAQDSPNPQ